MTDDLLKMHIESCDKRFEDLTHRVARLEMFVWSSGSASIGMLITLLLR